MAIVAVLTVAVRRMDEVLWAKQEVRRFLGDGLFDAADLARLEVATTELATNMIKHAGGGRLTVERVVRDGRTGVRMLAEDTGPGIEDLAAALRPGVSTAGSYGDGLAAVRELMDKFEITSEPGQWTRVEVEKWAA